MIFMATSTIIMILFLIMIVIDLLRKEIERSNAVWRNIDRNLAIAIKKYKKEKK